MDYQDRDRALESLGFADYEDYLKSPLWQVIRHEVLTRDEFVCRSRGCERRAEQVHHNSYAIEVLLGLEPSHLVSLCPACHRSLEWGDEGKRSLEEVVWLALETIDIPFSFSIELTTSRKIANRLRREYPRIYRLYRARYLPLFVP